MQEIGLCAALCALVIVTATGQWLERVHSLSTAETASSWVLNAEVSAPPPWPLTLRVENEKPVAEAIADRRRCMALAQARENDENAAHVVVSVNGRTAFPAKRPPSPATAEAMCGGAENRIVWRRLDDAAPPPFA